jgi:hypothetical protein
MLDMSSGTEEGCFELEGVYETEEDTGYYRYYKKFLVGRRAFPYKGVK